MFSYTKYEKLSSRIPSRGLKGRYCEK